MKKIFTLLSLMLVAFFSQSQSTTVVISQVYTGAGCTTAGCSAFTNDYIEIFNKSSAPVSLNGYSVQYTSATGAAGWQVSALPNVTLNPGQYFLVQQGGNVNGLAPLPTPDATGTLNMSATAGKVALVNATTALNGSQCPTPSPTIIDLVGFGSTANCFEGAAPAPAPGSNSNAIFRALNGCQDTQDNAADFAAATAAPRNTASPTNACGGATPTLIASPNITGITALVGNPSAETSFTLSGSNLTGFPSNITVTASSNIELSLTPGGPYTSSVNVAYGSATLAATTIYVRLAASYPAGSVNGTITIAGGGDSDGASITVTGTVSVPEPTVQATNVLITAVTNTSFTVNWTNGNGSGRIVTIRPNPGTKVAPVDGTAYAIPSNLGSSNFVYYVGSGSGPINVTGLVPGAGYAVQVYEYNGTGGGINYLTADATGNPATTTMLGTLPVLTKTNFTAVSAPQYTGSGNLTRLPVMYYATISGLKPNTIYRYVNQAAIASDFGTAALGAGNPLLINYTEEPAEFIYNATPGVNTANGYGLFETNAGGSFTGAFGFVTTGNASRFTAGVKIYPSIEVAENVSYPAIQYRYALNDSIHVLAFGNSASPDSGTFIKGLSAAMPGNVVGLWSTVDGNLVAQRPLAMTIVENITTLGPTTWAASFIPGYDETNGAWNTIIPNANANGVRLIQQFDLRTGTVVGCNSDADGIWPSGANTVNPTGGTTAIQITSTDAPLNGGTCFGIVLPVNLTKFTVQKSGNSTRILWTTAQEMNSREFEIERSINGGRTWTSVAIVAAAGNSNTTVNYNTTDFNPATGLNLYRLKTVDMDGRFSISDTKSALFGATTQVLITPNPTTDIANIYLSKTNNSVSQIVVTDMSGKVIDNIRTTDQTYTLTAGRYGKGMYIIKVLSEGSTSTHKIIVQ